MKIAITSQGDTLDSKMDTRFGRCSFFAIYDTQSKEIVFIPNENKDKDEGVGPLTVNLMVANCVDKVISGVFGVKIKSIMIESGIQMIALPDEKTINEIVTLLNR